MNPPPPSSSPWPLLLAGLCAAEQVLVEDHLHPPEHDHQLLGRENVDLLLKPGMTSSDPVGNSALSLLDPLVFEEDQADEVEHDLDLEWHDEEEYDDEGYDDLDQVGQLQT